MAVANIKNTFLRRAVVVISTPIVAAFCYAYAFALSLWHAVRDGSEVFAAEFSEAHWYTQAELFPAIRAAWNGEAD